MWAIYLDIRPRFGWIDVAARAALRDRLAGEDSADKVAVVIGGSAALAHALGLRKARLLILDFPEFTIENLLPHPQVTVASSYLGWMSFFMGSRFENGYCIHYKDRDTNNKGRSEPEA